MTDVTFFSDGVSRKDRRKKDSLRIEYFKTFHEYYSVHIDNIKYDVKFVGTTNKYKKLGFETYLDIDTLSKGKHLLKIKRKFIRTERVDGVRRNKETVNSTLVSIPFWNFKTNYDSNK